MVYEHTSSEPLWKALEKAFLAGRAPGFNDRFGYANELRILADLVEQRGDRGLDLDPGETADWLRFEAGRAETLSNQTLSKS